MTKVRVDIEFVQALKEARGVINRLPLKDIVWYKDGMPVKVEKKLLQQFEYCGLSNVDFIDFQQVKNGRMKPR